MTLVLTTNTSNKEQLYLLERLGRVLFTREKNFEIAIISPEIAAEPNFAITWSHKKILADRFVAGNERFTHFIYLEDDIEISFENFSYFVKYRQLLKDYALVPGFIRIEYNNTHNFVFSSDFVTKQNAFSYGTLRLDRTVFVCPSWPYTAMFMLDCELAEEHVKSKAFDATASREICDWGYAERAAAGLTWVDPPQGYRFRTMIPLCNHTQAPDKMAWVFHISSNYTNTEGKDFPLGRLSIDQLME